MALQRMPALFIGHGSPMNALGENRYTAAWREVAAVLPKPKAILVISAHWYLPGVAVTAMQQPKTIHDFMGFPPELYAIDYPVPGSTALAAQVAQLLSPVRVYQDQEQWGLDHGAWCVLRKMYPAADIPVIQLSIDRTQPVEFHYQLGRQLAALREQGILLLGSGNVVHNLRQIKWQGDMTAYPWAEEFNQFVLHHLTYRGEDHPLVHYQEQRAAQEACPTPEHYLPLLYILGSWDGVEPVIPFNNGIENGSLSMLSVQVG